MIGILLKQSFSLLLLCSLLSCGRVTHSNLYGEGGNQNYSQIQYQPKPVQNPYVGMKEALKGIENTINDPTDAQSNAIQSVTEKMEDLITAFDLLQTENLAQFSSAYVEAKEELSHAADLLNTVGLTMLGTLFKEVAKLTLIGEFSYLPKGYIKPRWFQAPNHYGDPVVRYFYLNVGNSTDVVTAQKGGQVTFIRPAFYVYDQKVSGEKMTYLVQCMTSTTALFKVIATTESATQKTACGEGGYIAGLGYVFANQTKEASRPLNLFQWQTPSTSRRPGAVDPQKALDSLVSRFPPKWRDAAKNSFSLGRTAQEGRYFLSLDSKAATTQDVIVEILGYPPGSGP